MCYNLFSCCDYQKAKKKFLTRIYGGCAIEDTKKLCYLDLSDLANPKLRDPNIVVPYACRIVQLQNRIFVTGGWVDKKSINTVSEFKEDKQVLVPQTDMLTARQSPGIARISSTSFCVIGGFVKKGEYLKECEQCEVKADKLEWKAMKPLQEAKRNVGAMLFNREVLYCFGGCIKY